jgi:hypothetical protein
MLKRLEVRVKGLIDNDRVIYRQPRDSYIGYNIARDQRSRVQQRAELARSSHREGGGVAPPALRADSADEREVESRKPLLRTIMYIMSIEKVD